MDSDSSFKFSLPFYLAISFHVLLVAFFILGLNFEPEIAAKKSLEAMQVAIVDTTIPIPTQGEQPNLLTTIKIHKRLSRLEKRHLARAKRQALRLAHLEQKKTEERIIQTRKNKPTKPGGLRITETAKRKAAVARELALEKAEEDKFRALVEQRLRTKYNPY